MTPTKQEYVDAMRIVYAYESRPRPATPNEYAITLARKLGVTIEQIRSTNRARPLVDRRKVFYYAMRDKFNLMTLQAIGTVMHRDHSTLLYYGNEYDTFIQYEGSLDLLKMAQA